MVFISKLVTLLKLYAAFIHWNSFSIVFFVGGLYIYIFSLSSNILNTVIIIKTNTYKFTILNYPTLGIHNISTMFYNIMLIWFDLKSSSLTSSSLSLWQPVILQDSIEKEYSGWDFRCVCLYHRTNVKNSRSSKL